MSEPMGARVDRPLRLPLAAPTPLPAFTQDTLSPFHFEFSASFHSLLQFSSSFPFRRRNPRPPPPPERDHGPGPPRHAAAPPLPANPRQRRGRVAPGGVLPHCRPPRQRRPPQGDREEPGHQREARGRRHRGRHQLPRHERAPRRRRRPRQARRLPLPRRPSRDGRQHVGYTSPSKKTPLEHSVSGGNLPAVRFLLDHGADLHQENEEGATVLHVAAIKGKCEIVKLLLSKGADVNGKSEEGTPLHLAAIKGHESTVEVLLEHHADVNNILPSCLATPLDVAVFAANTACVKLLIQAGANVNDVNNSLARAASEGLTEIAKCLLEHGAHPNLPDECGRLPIELAAVYGTREDVELLFPITSPIPNVADWSVDGVISHAKLESMQLMDDDAVNMRKSDLKQQADQAFEEQDYINASVLYTKALRADPSDRKVLAYRSRCWLRLGDGQKALEDAIKCKRSNESWAEVHHRQGEAHMLLKEYEKACEVLMRGLELDPENDEMDKLGGDEAEEEMIPARWRKSKPFFFSEMVTDALSQG